jgi:hypothetical protein
MLSVSALPWACQGISAALVVVPVMLAIAVGTPEAVAGTFAVHKVATASSVTTMLLVQPLWAEYVVLREQGRNATLMQTFTASLRRTLTVAVIFVVAVVAGANMINGWLHLSVSRSTYALAMVWAGVQGLRYTCLMLLLGTNHLRGVAVGSAAAVILTCVCTSFLPVESPTSIFAWVLIVDIALLLQHLQQVLFYFRLKIRPSDG